MISLLNILFAFVVASVFTLIPLYGFSKFDTVLKDSSFAPRLIVLLFFLTFLKALNSPGLPHEVQGTYIFPDYGVWIFCLVVDLININLMYTLQEPALAIISIFNTIYCIGFGLTQQSYTPMSDVRFAWPMINAVIIGFCVWLFFADYEFIDSSWNSLMTRFEFDMSKRPEGYVNAGLFLTPEILAVLVGIITYITIKMALSYSSVYMRPKPLVSDLLDPEAEGPEYLQRFFTAAQMAVAGDSDGIEPVDNKGPLKDFIQDRKFRYNLSTKSLVERQRLISSTEAARFDKGEVVLDVDEENNVKLIPAI